MATLKALRQSLGRALNELHIGELTAATVNQLTDDTLIDPDQSSSRYDRNWVKIVSGDADGEVRRVRATAGDIDGYDPENGTLQLVRALDDAPAIGDDYELHSLLSPDDIDYWINDTLATHYHVERETIDPVDDQREYSLAAHSWITSRSLVRRVFWRYGDTVDEYTYRPLRWWKITQDGSSFTLHVEPYDDDGKYILQGVKPYVELSTDTDSTDCPEGWVLAGAEMRIYRFLARNGPAEDSERYQNAEARARGRYIGLSRNYQPRPEVHVRTREYPWVV